LRRANVTYSNKKRRRPQTLPKFPKKAGRLLPKWVPYGATALLTLALCFTINFRAFTELNREVGEHDALNTQIESVTSENLNLQEEIYYLQNDPKTIEREARKFGLKRQEKKVPVSGDK